MQITRSAQLITKQNISNTFGEDTTLSILQTLTVEKIGYAILAPFNYNYR